MRRLRLWWLWGVELRLWVACSVAALCAFCRTFALSGTLTHAKAAQAPTEMLDTFLSPEVRIVFWATLALYNLDGTIDSPRRDPELASRRKLHLSLTVLAVLALSRVLFRFGSIVLLPVGVGFLACASYAVRVVVLGKSLQLKALPGIKAPFVGCAVATAVVCVPLFVATQSYRASSLALSAEVAALLASVASFCTANALLFDLPDIVEDREARIPSLPQIFGLKITRLVCLALTSLGSLLCLLCPTGARLPLLCLGLALGFAALLISPQTSKSKVAFWVDGALALPLIVAAFLS